MIMFTIARSISTKMFTPEKWSWIGIRTILLLRLESRWRSLDRACTVLIGFSLLLVYRVAECRENHNNGHSGPRDLAYASGASGLIRNVSSRPFWGMQVLCYVSFNIICRQTVQI